MNATLLGRLMPAAEQQEVHTIRLPVPPDQVWAALHAITYRDLPLMRFLMGVRALPARLGRGRGARRNLSLDEPLLGLFRRMGFVTVVEEPGVTLAMGVVAQFWRLSPTSVPDIRDGAALLSFNTPGYAKAVMSFEIAPDGAGSRLLTETRVKATDAAARRRFRIYWLVIRAGSGLIRRSILRAVKGRCMAAAS